MLPKITTILYAYDLDGKTHDTMALVLSLAKAHQAKVIFMHAMEPLGTQTVNMINNYIPEEALQTMRKEAKEETESRLQKSLEGAMQEYAKELADLATPDSNRLRCSSRYHKSCGQRKRRRYDCNK